MKEGDVENKTARHFIFAFMRNPVSVVNFLAIIFFAGVWYTGRENTLAKLSSDANASVFRMEKIESKIATGDVEDMIRSQKLEASVNRLENRTTSMEADIRWIVRSLGGTPQRPSNP